MPNPLPPGDLDANAYTTELAAASIALGELNGIGRTLQNPYLIIAPLQANEAITSSSMEGTYSTIDDLLIAETGNKTRSTAEDIREVKNYRQALPNALDSFDDLPLSLHTIKVAHAQLLQGVAMHRGAKVKPGEFKQTQNFIGARQIEDARFIPPPPQQTLDLMQQLEAFLSDNMRSDMPALVESALVHYQFETIHPFGDGNGRVGRMLITLHLAHRKIMQQPLLYLSPVLETRKDEYIDLMFEVSRSGDWASWIRFYLACVTRACERTVRKIGEMFDMQTNFSKRIREVSNSANAVTLVDILFERPIISIPQVQRELGVTYRAAQMNVDTLVSLDILRPMDHTSSPRLFVCQQLIDTIYKNDPDA
ncbi:MAG: Fic family protein [Pseudomonadota bacterium]